MTNGDKLNEILRMYFPNEIFHKSYHHDINTLKIHFTDEWLSTIYQEKEANCCISPKEIEYLKNDMIAVKEALEKMQNKFIYIDTDSIQIEMQNNIITHNINTSGIVAFALMNFPTDLQIDILQEECAELIKALSKYKREDYPNNETNFKSNEETRNNVIEEMSHVLISIDVVSSILKISASEIQEEITKKCKKYCNNKFGTYMESEDNS